MSGMIPHRNIGEDHERGPEQPEQRCCYFGRRPRQGCRRPFFLLVPKGGWIERYERSGPNVSTDSESIDPRVRVSAASRLSTCGCGPKTGSSRNRIRPPQLAASFIYHVAFGTFRTSRDVRLKSVMRTESGRPPSAKLRF